MYIGVKMKFHASRFMIKLSGTLICANLDELFGVNVNY